MTSANKQNKQDKKNKKIIKIRGHHLDFLYYWINGIDIGAFNEDDYITTQMLKGYGEKNAKETWGLIETLYNKEVKVKITRDLDGICLADCKRKEKSCEGDKDPPDLDKKVALYYELKPGKVYSSKKVLDSIRKKDTTYKVYHMIKYFEDHPMGTYY